MSNMKNKRTIGLWIAAFIAFLGLLVYVFFTYIGGYNSIVGRSMEPTLKDGMLVYVSKLAGDKQAVKQGDIIIYTLSSSNESEFISRVIATEGDSVMIAKGSVQVNGKEYVLPNIPNPVTAIFEGGVAKEGMMMIVPAGSVYVLGDNRMRSADSRDFGFIKKENIQGVYQYCYSHCQ